MNFSAVASAKAALSCYSIGQMTEMAQRAMSLPTSDDVAEYLAQI